MDYGRQNKNKVKSKAISTGGIIMILLIISPILFFALIIPQVMVFILLFPLAWILISLSISLNPLKDGCEIKGEFFYISGYMTTNIIKISDMEIGLVAVYSEWSPVEQLDLVKSSGMIVGNCLLKNGKRAFVFQKMGYTHYLLIVAKESYYLIGEAGISDFYEELTKLGAKEKTM